MRYKTSKMNKKQIIKYLNDNYISGVDFKPKGNCKTCFNILNSDILRDEVMIKYMEEKNKLNK
tara:strand:- start:37 stop:225 length:189 start_codon:yes stop_codon:yes gene_type:complete